MKIIFEMKRTKLVYIVGSARVRFGIEKQPVDAGLQTNNPIVV